MKIRVNNRKLHDIGIICFLCIYFTTKLLWDSVPYVFELASLGIIVYGAMRAMQNKLNKRTGIFLIFLIYCVYVIINAFLQDSINQIQRALYEYILYGLIFWGNLYWGKKSKLEDYATIILNIGVIISLLSWIEYFSHHYIMPNTGITYIDYVGFRSIVFSRTFLAHGIVLAYFSIFGIYMFLAHRKNSYLIRGLMAFVSILSTGSRGPLVACFVGIFVMFVCYEFSSKYFSVKKITIFFCVFFAICFAWYIMTSDFQLSNPTVNYFLNRMRSILDWSSDDGNTGRIVIWSHYFKVFKEHFWFGLGPSQTGSWNLNGLYGATESGILKRLCELGIVGGFIYYLYVFNIFFHGIKSYKVNRTDINMIFYIGLFVTIFLDDITLQATEEIIVSFFMWYALAGIENSRNKLIYKG